MRPIGAERRRSGAGNGLRRGFRQFCVWWRRVVERSLVAALVIVLTSAVGGTAGVLAFVYGAFTAPRQLRAQQHQIDLLITQRKEDHDFLVWLTLKRCGEIPAPLRKYSEDARACGAATHLTGLLFMSDTIPR